MIRSFAQPHWLALSAAFVCACSPGAERQGEPTVQVAEPAPRSFALDLWATGQPAFGVYVPDERPREERMQDGQRVPPLYTVEGARRLADNPLYDFLFLNLEGAYDVEAVETLVTGLSTAPGRRKMLLVRIPPISADGEEAAAERVSEILALGADGIVLPHVRSVEEARTAIGFFSAVGADVWTPAHPEGRTAAMLMLEDPQAVAAAALIADLGGYTLLACGIGSLTGALDGDREAAERGNMAVLAEATRVGMADMITANEESIERRVEEGFLGLLMQGPTADDIIRLGLAAAGRPVP